MPALPRSGMPGRGGTGRLLVGGLGTTLAVTAVEPGGAETFCYGRIDGGSAEVIVRLGGKSVPVPGDRLAIVADRGQLHVFD